MNQNIEYERLAQEVYQGLINADGVKTIDVKHNVKLVGKSGQAHQIDVYWEYEIAGVTHKVAIECKNYNKAVQVGKVRDFYGVLSDLNNVAGIMVTKVGYQEGAKEYASHYGISLKELRTPNEQDWNGRIRKIVLKGTTISPKIKECYPILDEDWIRANITFPDEEFKTCQLHFEGLNAEIFVYDKAGKSIVNFLELESKLVSIGQDAATDVEHIYLFDDAYMDFSPLGRVKIKGVKYIYDVVLHEAIELMIDAQDIIKAILKDALIGDIKFIHREVVEPLGCTVL